MAGTTADRLYAIASLARRVLDTCQLTREVGGVTLALLARVSEDEAFCSAVGRGACAALHMSETVQHAVFPELERRLLEWRALGGFSWIRGPAADATLH